jgi:hypothetical protein
VLTDPAAGPDPATLTWLTHTGPQLGTALVFGGKVAVSPTVDGVIGKAIGGTVPGYDQATNPTGLTY